MRRARRSRGESRVSAREPAKPISPDTGVRRILPIALLAALVLVFFAGLLISPSDQLMAGPDIQRYFLYLHSYAQAEWSAGRAPLWNPFNYGGLPFAANPQCSVFYPPTWIYLLFPVANAEKYLIALHCLLAGVFMYLYLRRVGCTPGAGITGALPWMFGNYFMANAVVGHLTMIFTMAWLPLALYCCERGLQSRRWVWFFWTGIVVGVQLLAGEPQNNYYTVLLLGVYGLVRSLAGESGGTKWWQPRRHQLWLAGLTLAGVTAAVTAAVQLLPTMEFMLRSDRSANTYEFATFVSFPPSSALGLLVPYTDTFRGFGATIDSNLPYSMVRIQWELAAYCGGLTLALAGISFAVRRQPVLTAVRVVLVLAVILMLGRYTPFFAVLFKLLPGLTMFRIPARAVLLAEWALAVAAAFGFDFLLQPNAPRWRRLVPTLVLVVLALVTVLVVVSMSVMAVYKAWDSSIYTSVRVHLWDWMAIRPLLCLIGAAAVIALLPRLRHVTAVILLIAALAVDLLISKPPIPLKPYRESQDAAVQMLRRLPPAPGGSFRVDFAPKQVLAEAALAARVENMNGYWPLSLKRTYEFCHWMRGQSPPPRQRHQIWDQTYSGNPFPLRIMNVRYASRLDAKGDVSVVEDPHSLPRAWLVDRCEVISEEKAVVRRLRDPQFDPGKVVILEQPPPAPLTTGSDSAGQCVVHQGPQGALDISIEAVREAYLVISHIYYPGWVARIDGVRTPLERADYLISALRVPSGSHQVILRYEPLSFKLGIAGTTASCLLVVALLILAWRKRSKPIPAGNAAHSSRR